MESRQELIDINVEARSETVCDLKQFIHDHYGSVLIKGDLDASMICLVIERRLQIAAVRMKIDCKRGSNALAGRLSFEFMAPSDRTLTEAMFSLLKQAECDLQASIEHLERSASVLRRLPYSSLQPAINQIDLELYMHVFNNAKTCLNLNGLAIKDCCLVRREILGNVAL